MVNLTEAQFSILRTLVTIAKEHQIETVESLRLKIKHLGFDDADVNAAIQFWAQNLPVKD